MLELVIRQSVVELQFYLLVAPKWPECKRKDVGSLHMSQRKRKVFNLSEKAKIFHQERKKKGSYPFTAIDGVWVGYETSSFMC